MFIPCISISVLQVLLISKKFTPDCGAILKQSKMFGFEDKMLVET